MKKAFSAILSIALLIGLTACADKAKTVDAVQTGAVVFSATETVFEEGTEVTAETIQAGDIYDRAEEAVKDVAKQFTVYEFNAIKDGAQVQPNGSLAVTFRLPEGYSQNATVYYVAENGTSEPLATTVDINARTVLAALTHFSTYVLADLGDEADTATQSTDKATETSEADETSETTTIASQNTTTPAKTSATTKTKTPPSRSTSTNKKTTTTGETKWLEAVPFPSKQYGEINRQTKPNAGKNTTSNKTIQDSKKTTNKPVEHTHKQTVLSPTTSTRISTTSKTTISKIDIRGKTFQGYGRVEDDGCYYDVTVTFGKGVGQAMYVDTRICAPVDEYCAEMGPDMTVDKFLNQVKKEEPDSLVLFEGKYYYAVMGGGPGDLVITSIDISDVSFKTVPDTEHGETPIEYKIKFNIKGNDLTIRHINPEFSHLAAGAVLTLVK